jgi:phage terminase large subunit
MAGAVRSVEGFYYTTAIAKLRQMKKRVRVVPGGTSAGKTYGILPLIIDYCIKHPGTDFSVVSETVPHLRKGALKDFLTILKATGRYFEEHYNKTLLVYTFSNGSYIEFFSADQEAKVRGPRRKGLYINECNNVDFETYHQLAIRTSEIIWLDFNPSNQFWVHEELADDPDAEWLTLTYKDNEALAEAIVREIEKAKAKAYFNPNLEGEALFSPANIKSYYWHNYWRVYGLGLLGSLEGVIFQDWSQVATIPKEAELIGYGIDFGFSSDPSTIIGVWEWKDSVIFDEVLYRAGLTNGELAKLMRNYGLRAKDYIVADSSEPKSIAEINAYGFHVVGAMKGRDSINFGIDVLQDDHFYVTQRSTNMIHELRSYIWDTDKNGKTLPKPIDAFNHCIDPMRYIAMAKLSKKGSHKAIGVTRRN